MFACVCENERDKEKEKEKFGKTVNHLLLNNSVSAQKKIIINKAWENIEPKNKSSTKEERLEPSTRLWAT